MLDFNEWLLKTYGITSDNMTDDDYDVFYKMYEEYRTEADKEESEG